MSQNYGTKRIVTGARYGRARLAGAAHHRHPDGLVHHRAVGPSDFWRTLSATTSWAGIFSSQWMKTLTFAVIMAMLYHVWVGVRDIFMDYIKPVSIRLSLHVFAIVWLVGCAGWAIQVLWRL
jgi:succinate dehydrogenase / fumarate reductase membrane anchor subunit